MTKEVPPLAPLDDGQPSGSEGTPAPPAPDWYPVDGDPTHLRYWDGRSWSAERRWDGTQWIDSATPPAQAPAPAGSTKTNRLKRVGKAYATAGVSEIVRSRRNKAAAAPAAQAQETVAVSRDATKDMASVPVGAAGASSADDVVDGDKLDEDGALAEDGTLDVEWDDAADDVGPHRALYRYTVNYRGGHPDFPKRSASGFRLELHLDRFEIHYKQSTRKGMHLVIPYAKTRDVEIVDRIVGTGQALLGGLNSRQLNQKNNVEITYLEGGREVVVRFEMISGVSVMGQARKCRELMDHIRNIGARDQFIKDAPPAPVITMAAPTPQLDIPDQIAKLAALRDSGVLSEEEFAEKKAELLKRL